MATRKQTQAAKRNVKKAQKAAAGQKTIAHLPADTKSALGKQGAAVAQRKRTGGTSPKTRAELYEIARQARSAWQVENGPRRTSQEARREIARDCLVPWLSQLPLAGFPGLSSVGCYPGLTATRPGHWPRYSSLPRPEPGSSRASRRDSRPGGKPSSRHW